MTDKIKPDSEDFAAVNPQLSQLVDAIVEMHRRVYAFDLDLDNAVAELWREQQAKGVSRKTFHAATVLARSRTVEFFKDYVKQANEGALERLDHPEDDA